MSFFLERTVREHRPTDKDGNWATPTLLTAHSATHAWVLIGDPGAGKTEAFNALAQAEGGTCITTRDFIELDPPAVGYCSPLFIDGLDEYTAAQGNTGQAAIGLIRSKLQQLGTPPFRIACREADWRGSTDSEALQRLVTNSQVPGSTFSELHLEPLTEAQTIEFIRHQKQWDDAQARSFIHSAQAHDLEGLLDNPQTLLMLLQSVTQDQPQFPTSKLEAYQRACVTLMQEHNAAHLAASGQVLLTHVQVLQAAGYLCAVMLLSGSSLIAKQPSQQHPAGVLVLRTLLANQPNAPTLEACQEAIQTKLFTGTGSGSFVPRHRTVAEYLAADYVAQRLQEGLPLTRVLALMQGEDGGVVPALRGLHAWLAVVASAHVRENLIARDPLGLVLHGDVRGFTPTEKIRLLEALKGEATRYTHFRSQNWASQPFGALATPDMQAHFQALLRSPDRSPTHLAVLDCVLDAMRHGHAMPALAPELEQVVRDKTCWERMRRTALVTLARHEPANSQAITLRQLLEDIGTGKVEDHDMELRGVLLRHLYPRHMTATELWRWYVPIKSGYLGEYWRFWHELPRQNATAEHATTVLDALLTSDIRLQPGDFDHDLQEIVGILLCKAILECGEVVEIQQLFAWLGLGLHEYNNSELLPEHRSAVASWLSAHPVQYKALVEYGISQLEWSDTLPHLWLYELRNRLCQADPPADASEWLLSLAESRNDDFRYQLIDESYNLTKQREGVDAALDRLTAWGLSHPSDTDWIHRALLTRPYPPEPSYQEHIDREIQRKARINTKKAEELRFLRENLPGLAGPQPHLGLLNHMGETYFGDFTGRGDTPKARLLKALNDDPHWVDMALAGLRQCLGRTDLPTADSIVAKHLKDTRYRLAMPCLAAIDLRYTEHPATAFDRLPTACLETLVAFRLTNDYGEAPAWFNHLVTTQPDLVGGVMQHFMLRQMAAKREHISGAYALVHDGLYATMAQRIGPALIQALPAKAAKKQLTTVRELIACLLNRLPVAAQLALIGEKLALPNMDVAQRAYWQTAGLLVNPEPHFEPLKAFLGSNQIRASHAFDLLHALKLGVATIERLAPEVRALFIELLGARFAPSVIPTGGRDFYTVTPAIETAEFVQRLITSLAADHTDAATQALSSLAQNAALKTWREHIRHAAYEQHIARRKALFQSASVDAVCKTLANRQPANAADLWALTVDHLTTLADSIRNGSTNDYKQYWNGDKPRIENDCRDALLSDLKVRLAATGVSAEREGNYADDKRADIKLLFGNWHIPVEIKRDTHPDVWTAIPKQLIAKYSREAASEGYGIYIVFWFQGKLKATAADGGRPPRTPQELQQRLTATVPPELKSKIAVRVLDCSLPSANQQNTP